MFKSKTYDVFRIFKSPPKNDDAVQGVQVVFKEFDENYLLTPDTATLTKPDEQKPSGIVVDKNQLNGALLNATSSTTEGAPKKHRHKKKAEENILLDSNQLGDSIEEKVKKATKRSEKSKKSKRNRNLEDGKSTASTEAEVELKKKDKIKKKKQPTTELNEEPSNEKHAKQPDSKINQETTIKINVDKPKKKKKRSKHRETREEISSSDDYVRNGEVLKEKKKKPENKNRIEVIEEKKIKKVSFNQNIAAFGDDEPIEILQLRGSYQEPVVEHDLMIDPRVRELEKQKLREHRRKHKEKKMETPPTIISDPPDITNYRHENARLTILLDRVDDPKRKVENFVFPEDTIQAKSLYTDNAASFFFSDDNAEPPQSEHKDNLNYNHSTTNGKSLKNDNSESETDI